MIFFFLLLAFCWAGTLFAQTVHIGDTENKHVQKLELQVYNSKAAFDFDCDGIGDVVLESVSSSCCQPKIWGRLSLLKGVNVEVLNSGVGAVTTFNVNDTINLSSDARWTKNLDFIYGEGAGGTYGQQISKKFIVFRKSSPTKMHYLFMEINNSGVNLTVHQVISECENTFLRDNLGSSAENILIFPNPVQNDLRVESKTTGNFNLIIYNAQGCQVKEFLNMQSGKLNVSDFPRGTYLIKSSQDKRAQLFIKQ